MNFQKIHEIPIESLVSPYQVPIKSHRPQKFPGKIPGPIPVPFQEDEEDASENDPGSGCFEARV